MLKSKKPKIIGRINHYFTAIKVATIKCKLPLKIGQHIKIKGATTDLDEVISSMQYNHKDIKVSKKGQEVGIKVSDRVREGDDVYLVE